MTRDTRRGNETGGAYTLDATMAAWETVETKNPWSDGEGPAEAAAEPGYWSDGGVRKKRVCRVCGSDDHGSATCRIAALHEKRRPRDDEVCSCGKGGHWPENCRGAIAFPGEW